MFPKELLIRKSPTLKVETKGKGNVVSHLLRDDCTDLEDEHRSFSFAYTFGCTLKFKS
jgi:hypothetical protein